MGNPTTGFDISAKLNNASSSATSAVSGGVGSLTKAASAKSDSIFGKALITGIGRVAEKQTNKAMDKASGKLQQKVGGVMDKVNGAMDKVNKLKNAASKLGDVANKLPGMAGGLTKSVGGASKIAGLAKSLMPGGSALDEQAQAAVAATSLINAQLADTLFVAKPDEKLVVADVFGIKDNTPLNTVVDKLKGEVQASLSDMGGLAGIGKNLLSGTLHSGNINLDPDALKGRLIDQLGGKAGIMNKLSGGLREGLSAIGLPKGVYDRVEATVMGVKQFMDSRNVQDARGTFDILSRITGESEIASFLDVGAQASLMSSLTREMINLGVPDAITVLLQKSKSDEAAYWALQSNIIVAANVADLKTVDMMTDTLGSQRMLSDCPDIISQILAGYRFPTGTTVADYQARYDSLNATFTALDPHWGYSLRGSEYVTSTDFFKNISADARELLSHVGPFTDIIMFADSYPETELMALTTRMYPGILVVNNYSYRA